jgi:hypothetical protein
MKSSPIDPQLNENFVVTESVFADRLTTRCTLWRSNIHLIWHPQFIDLAMHYAPGETSLTGIVASGSFLAACDAFCRRADSGLDTKRITADAFRDTTVANTFLEAFFRQQTAKTIVALRATNRTHSAREEIANALRYQFVLNAGKYTPGVDLGNGTFRTLGYSAFQRSYLRAAWNWLRRDFRRCVVAQRQQEVDVTEDLLNAQAVQVSPEFRMTLLEALRRALPDVIGWRVFVAMIFDDQLMEDVASELGVSPAYISTSVTPYIVSTIQASFDVASRKSMPRIKITDLRESLGQLISKEDFIRAVPAPCSRGGSHLRSAVRSAPARVCC